MEKFVFLKSLINSKIIYFSVTSISRLISYVNRSVCRISLVNNAKVVSFKAVHNLDPSYKTGIVIHKNLYQSFDTDLDFKKLFWKVLEGKKTDLDFRNCAERTQNIAEFIEELFKRNSLIAWSTVYTLQNFS